MDQLRVTAAYFIKESDITKAAKLQLINFLENEATDAQIMALLLDGKIQILDEMAEDIVYDRWDAALLEGKIGYALKKAKVLTKRGIHRTKRQIKTSIKHGADVNPFGSALIVKSRKTGKKVAAIGKSIKPSVVSPFAKRRTIMLPHKKAMKVQKKYRSQASKAGMKAEF